MKRNILKKTMALFMAVLTLFIPFNTYASINSDIKIEQDDDRTGKTVTVFMKEDGTTVVVEGKQGGLAQQRAGDVLVSTYILSASQTAQIQKNIQNITQVTSLISILTPFIPNPFAAAFLTAANVSALAEDLRWAGLYGKRVRFEEYCRTPHTSYSHYFRYTILD